MVPEDDPKKKKRKTDDDDPDADPDAEEVTDADSSPFGDDFFKELSKQFGKAFTNFPAGMPPIDFNSDEFKKMFSEIFKQFQNMDPEQIKKIMEQFQNMDPEQGRKMMEQFQNMNPEMAKKLFANRKFGIKTPFSYKMKFRMGPDGKPIFDSFGNVEKKSTKVPEKEPEARPERDPLVDVYEEDDQIVVVMEVPGVEKDQIKIEASSMELEIIANNTENREHPVSYRKSIPLPKEINPNVAKARYTNGILEVKLTKVGEKQQKKKINID